MKVYYKNPSQQDIGVRGQAAATMEGTQPVHAEKEVATPVVTTEIQVCNPRGGVNWYFKKLF